jgi:hypothetical protein
MNNKLFVGSLAWETTNESLQDFFAQIGNVVSARVVFDRQTGRSKGFGFVDDIFVPPSLISTKNDGDEVTVIAIYAFNKAKEKYGWKAISIG